MSLKDIKPARAKGLTGVAASVFAAALASQLILEVSPFATLPTDDGKQVARILTEAPTATLTKLASGDHKFLTPLAADILELREVA